MKIQTHLEDLGNFLGVDTSMSFNFSELLSSVTMEQRDRSASTRVSLREIDRGSKNVKRKVEVKTEIDEYEEQRSTEEGNSGRPNIKGVVAKFARSKPNINDEDRQDDEDEIDKQKERAHCPKQQSLNRQQKGQKAHLKS